MNDVAREAGVSKSTVSRALNNSPMISEAVRRKVAATCERLGYRINPSIQDLVQKGRNGRTRSLAFVQVGHEFANPAYAPIIDGLAEAAGEADYLLGLARLTGTETQVYDLPRILRDRRVDGFLVSGYLTAKLTRLFDDLGLPYVVLGSYGEAVVRNCLCVHGDMDAVMAELVEALKRDGRRRIAYFSEEKDLFSSRRALTAFEMAVRETGLEYRPELVFTGDGPYCGAVRFLAAPFREERLAFDGIVVYDYRNALEVSHLIAARDGLGSARPKVMLATVRPYTYYHLPIPAIYADGKGDEVARVGARQLIDCINRGEPCRPGKIMVRVPVCDPQPPGQERDATSPRTAAEAT
ncbi:MAG: hypothetical protein A3K19_29510 [Lentisphaerae bacterium RIFOXYB12_FULL_65_16]|nr:MAG: hypothetical protein A3K18_33195 [Lentisphaerae bacterium RIFOXYA12_64_32]OGV88294.1 MAG: hypothetical protein A3K19_29510 [Lentisphaerae bacterium RIFOXYB12_FULL_65_16]